ncbi:hypothetical protein COB72_07745 [bacterium]|nr:MAG: hypothetical protein COB72_07745 [bacterium]
MSGNIKDVDFNADGYEICRQLGECSIRWEWSDTPGRAHRVEINGQWLYLEFNDGFETVDYLEYLEYFPSMLIEYRLYLDSQYLGFAIQIPKHWKYPHSRPPWYEGSKLNWFCALQKSTSQMVLRNLKR